MMKQKSCVFKEISIEDRRWIISSGGIALNKFVGNEEAIRRLSRAVFSAYGNSTHNCSDYSFALCGPPSTGKTHLAKLFAQSVCLPFVVIEPQTVKKVHDVFEEIQKVCDNYENSKIKKGDLSLFDEGGDTYCPPPMIVFIDEVHNLRSNVVQGLLKATEPNDRLMITEKGYTVRTNNICWMIATTDRGDLFDAFDTRFQKVSLRLYSKKEMAQIIKSNNPDWDDDVCMLVATYNSQVPREALAFARDMRVEKEINPVDWKIVADTVARDHGIDEFGMTHVRVNVLKALGMSPISASQLPFVAHVKEEELRKYVMPPLLCRTPDQPDPLVTVSSKGYTITQAGLKELDRRKIPHKGIEAIPESVRSIFTTEVSNAA
jgi:Holliday junction resolvasome RuvABC ATP-dependent DNA helicase subunit